MTEDKSAPKPGCECPVCEFFLMPPKGQNVRPNTPAWTLLLKRVFADSWARGGQHV